MMEQMAPSPESKKPALREKLSFRPRKEKRPAPSACLISPGALRDPFGAPLRGGGNAIVGRIQNDIAEPAITLVLSCFVHVR